MDNIMVEIVRVLVAAGERYAAGESRDRLDTETREKIQDLVHNSEFSSRDILASLDVLKQDIQNALIWDEPSDHPRGREDREDAHFRCEL